MSGCGTEALTLYMAGVADMACYHVIRGQPLSRQSGDENVGEKGAEREEDGVYRKKREEGVVKIHSIGNIYLWQKLPEDLFVVTR